MASSAFFRGDYSVARELLAAHSTDEDLIGIGKNQNAAVTDCLLGLSSRSQLLLRLESVLAGKDWTTLGAEASTLFFNMASLHFDKHRDEHARVLVDSLFDKLALAPLDLGLSVKICLLLIEVHVRIWCSRGGTPCHSGEHRMAMQQRMHSAFGRLDEYLSILADAPMLSSSEVDNGNGNGNGKQKGQQPQSNSISSTRKNLLNALKFRILLYRSRVLLCFGRLAHASEALGRAIEVYDVDLQPLLLTFKDAEKGAPIIPGLSACKDDNGAYYGTSFSPRQLQRQFAWAGLMRAQLECLRTDDGDRDVKTKVERLLVSPAAHSSPDAANNTACTCLRAGKYHAATLFATQAVTAEKEKAKLLAGELEGGGSIEGEEEGGQGQRDAAARSPDLEQTYFFEMLYNQGVSLLLAGRPREAFLCLQKTKPVLGPQLPYLWIRMAECCIHVNHNREHIKKAEIGGRYLLQETSLPPKSDPGMSLAHAAKYLITALSMIRQRCSSSASPSAAAALPTALGADKSSDELDEFEADAESVGQFLRLEELVLTHSAYVHLCLGDNMLAVAVSREILARPGITERTRNAATSYLVEGLLATGKVDQTVGLYDSFSPTRQAVEGCFVPSAWSSTYSPHCASSGEKVVGQLCIEVNKAAVALCSGRVEQAQAALEQVLAVCPSFVPAVKGLALIHLKKQDREKALQVIIS